ncbi:MAG: hypothetical protein AAFX94_13150, partial [Myxococcota bacterium]
MARRIDLDPTPRPKLTEDVVTARQPSRQEPPAGRTELFPTGRSNGRGYDVRRYLAAAKRPAPSPEPQAQATVRAETTAATQDVFEYTKRELVGIPGNASPHLMRRGMDAIIEALVNDARWPQPLIDGQEPYAGPGFTRPIEIRDGELAPQSREAVQAWVDAGGLDGFREGMRNFARAIGRRLPPGHPQRAMALAAGYEAFAGRFYVHGGQMDYAVMGTDRDDLDWADLVTAPYAQVNRDPTETRTRIDCRGYDMLATEFYEAAGLEVFSNTSMIDGRLNAHRQGIAVDGTTQIGFSNGAAFVLPEPSSGELGSTFLA